MMNKKKALTILLMSLMMISSVFQLAYADEIDTNETNDSTNEADEEPDSSQIETATEDAGSYPECVRIAAERFPDASPARLMLECRKLYQLAEEIKDDYSDRAAAAAEIRLRNCRSFLEENTDIEAPLAVCRRIVEAEKDCVDILTEEGVDFPLAKCDRIFMARTIAVTAANKTAIAEAIRAKLPEWRAKAAEKLSKDKPKLAEFVNGLDDDDAEKFLKLSKSEQNRILSMAKQQAVAMLARYKIKKVDPEELYRQRQIKTEQIEQARERFQTAKERYDEAKAEYKDAYQEFRDAVADGDDEAAMGYAKEFLGKAADMVIETLEKVKAEAEGNDDLSQDEAAEIIADIDAKIEQIKAAKADVESAETKDEVKEAGYEIIQAWERMREQVRLHAARTIKAQVSDVLQRATMLERNLEKTIANLEDKGYDVAEVEDDLLDFEGLIASAREKFSDAKEKLDEARELAQDGSDEATQEHIDQLISEAKASISDAHKDLQDAHALMVVIVKEIKNIAPNQEIETTEETEIVELD